MLDPLKVSFLCHCDATEMLFQAGFWSEEDDGDVGAANPHPLHGLL